MSRQLFLLAFVAVALQQIECATRTDIRNQYQPTLLRLRDVASTKLAQANREYNALTAQLKEQQNRGINITQTQINNIRSIIAQAKKTANATDSALACVRNQDATANRLSTSALNSCYSNSDLSVLRGVINRFSTITGVATNTVNYCQYLNPLDSQLEPYEKCLSDKVPDLNRQINLIDGDYKELSNSTLSNNVKCLTDSTGGILSQISLISYEINLCFFNPL